MYVLRPSQRIIHIPPGWMQIRTPKTAAAAPASWWVVAGKTCVAAYQAKGAASLAASYSNLANPGTYDAAPGVAPTWSAATGWTFDGSTQYLGTGIVPAYNGLSSWAIRFSDLPADDSKALFGAFNEYGGDGAIYIYTGSGGELVPSNGAVVAALTSGASRGAAHVVVMAGPHIYIDGFDVTTVPEPIWPPSGNTSTVDIYIAAIHAYWGSAWRLAAFKGQAFAAYSDTLSAPDVATLSTAMAAL